MCGCSKTPVYKYNSPFYDEQFTARSIASAKGWHTRRANAEAVGVVFLTNGGGYKAKAKTLARTAKRRGTSVPVYA